MRLDIGEATPEERNALLACLMDAGWQAKRIFKNRYIVEQHWPMALAAEARRDLARELMPDGDTADDAAVDAFIEQLRSAANTIQR